MNRKAAKRAAFTLVETVMACAILAMFASFAVLTGSNTVERYADPTSERQIEIEINNLVANLQNAIYRSLVGKRDFSLRVYGTQATQTVRIKWLGGPEESWKLENIAVLNILAADAPGAGVMAGSTYSSRFQTLTPAITLRVYTAGQTPRPKGTNWHIVISAYGSVTVQRI